MRVTCVCKRHLIKPVIECAINTLDGNYKLSEEEKGKLSKYKNRLRALVNPKITYLLIHGAESFLRS